MIPAERNGRIILASDGHWPLDQARAQAATAGVRSIPVDTLLSTIETQADAAVLAVEVPEFLRLGTGFIGAAQLISPRDGNFQVTITTPSGRTVHEQDIWLGGGVPANIRFADRPHQPGIMRYNVELQAANSEFRDSRLGNNQAQAALRVIGGEGIVVISATGSGSNIARALRATGMHVTERAEGPITLDELLGFSGCILDNVPAHVLGWNTQQALAQWVEHMGGGLVVCGGRRAFGSGGYHKSPLENILPVTCELRDEHRKLSVSLAIVADRSGSMGVEVAPGRTKMDLANAGIAAAIELLSPMDEVAVYAVDTGAHVVIPPTRINNSSALQARAHGIRSTGGGIFIEEALVAALPPLLRSDRASRHLILFSDAADSEKPGAYRQLIQEARQAGVTVSVIGLGTENDMDAALLQDIAELGGGRMMFSNQPQELPQLFAQETVLIARSAWVDGPVQAQVQPSLRTWLPALPSAWPAVPGYNLTYPRPQADVDAWLPGDPSAPGLARWHRGAGRCVAIGFACDDQHSLGLLQWQGYAPLIAGATRWAVAGGGFDLFAVSADIIGESLVVRVEGDPERREEWPASAPQLMVVNADQPEKTAPTEHSLGGMVAINDGVWQQRIPLNNDQVIIPSVRIGSDTFFGPARNMPYDPELAPLAANVRPDENMRQLARASGGTMRSNLLHAFDNPPSPGERRDIAWWCVVAAILCLLAEILWRRWGIGQRYGQPVIQTPTASQNNQPDSVPNQAVMFQRTGSENNASSDKKLDKAEGMHEALKALRKHKGQS